MSPLSARSSPSWLEGHCPRCLAALVPGLHGDRYGWCSACQLGYQTERCVEPADIEFYGRSKVTVFWPSDFRGCGPA